MQKITIGWMYPDLLNLHGERGSVQALVETGRSLGVEVAVRRIESPEDTIPFEELDLLVFLPGEIAVFETLMPALKKQKAGLEAYLGRGGYLLALGTTGLMFGKQVLREDDSTLDCLGYLDMTAKERKYVWGDDLHLRLLDSKQELVGSQIQMADVETATPLAQVLYGRGNNCTGFDGCRKGNLIYTNCLGPLFVKNPWFAEAILKEILLQKLGVQKQYEVPFASDSFDSTLRFIAHKQRSKQA